MEKQGPHLSGLDKRVYRNTKSVEGKLQAEVEFHRIDLNMLSWAGLET